MDYEKIFKTLNQFKVQYLLGGGLAVNFYGVPRFTKDIDLLIETGPGNIARLKKALKGLGYQPKVPVSMEDFLNPAHWQKWKREKGMLALNLFNPKKPFEEIDLLVNTPLSFEDAVKNRVKLASGKLMIYLVGMEDLILMKRQAGRAQDLSDIEALKKVKRIQKNP